MLRSKAKKGASNIIGHESIRRGIDKGQDIYMNGE